MTNEIRRFRFENDEMTQADLADRIGVTRQTVIAIEQGRYSPSLEMAFQIARVFRVPLDEVFQYGREPSRDDGRHLQAHEMKPHKSDEPTPTAWLPPRWFIRIFWAGHRAIHTATRGRIGLKRPATGKWGMMRLQTIGRRSGAPRSAILGYFEDGADLVTMAMNGWGEPEPAWWLNLQAHPETSVELVDGSRRRPRACGDRRRTGAPVGQVGRVRREARCLGVAAAPGDCGRDPGTIAGVAGPTGRGMKAITHRRYGPPDVLAFEELPRPEPGPGDVLVRVRAASIFAGDWHVVRGSPFFVRFATGLRRPRSLVPGMDLAGVVEGVGSAVTGFQVGRRRVRVRGGVARGVRGRARRPPGAQAGP